MLSSYDWCRAWLKAEDYEHILTHVSSFQQLLNLDIYPARTHPADIYSDPVHGSVYLVKGKSLSLDVSFPVPRRAQYKWKKTGMPKQSRGISYLVAEASHGDDQCRYRMLAVTLTSHQSSAFILCHIRRINDLSASDDAPSPVKRGKKSELEECNGLYALLEAANSLKSDGKRQEVDYVTLFQCSLVRKFPLLSTASKPAFEVIPR